MKLTKISIMSLSILLIVAFAGVSYAADTVVVPAGYMADTTTPFAVWFSSDTAFLASLSVVTCKSRLQIPAGAINTLTNAFTWDTTPAIAIFAGDAQSWATCHTLPITAGVASGWLFVKSVGIGVGTSTCTVRLRNGAANADLYTQPLLTAWNSSNAGWLIDTTVLGPNIVALAKDSVGNILGSYISEDNTINEGYPAVPGYVKMAVPVGEVASIEYRSLSNAILGTKTGPWMITPGAETYTPVKLSRFEAIIKH